MDSWASWTGSDSSSGGSVSIGFYLHPRCRTDGYHTIRFMHARGSNGVARREHGKCEYCGKKYVRTIRWEDRDARWWEPTDSEAA